MATKKATTKKTTTKKTTTKKTTKKAPKKKTSPYGVALELMGKNPDQSKKELLAGCKRRKIDVDAGSTAITTAYSCARTLARLFRENGHMSPAPEKD